MLGFGLLPLSELSAVGVYQAKGTGGTRGYLAVSGGLDMPVYLGSRATFPGGKLGGVQACGVTTSDAIFSLLFGEARAHSMLGGDSVGLPASHVPDQ